MKILFLDDDFDRVKSFIERTGADVLHAKNGEEFCAALNNGTRYDLIMLDHDLGLDGPDGYDGSKAAKYLAENRLLIGDDQRVIIHSANPIGVANMLSHMKYSDHLRVDVVNYAWIRCMKDPNCDGIIFGYPKNY